MRRGVGLILVLLAAGTACQRQDQLPRRTLSDGKQIQVVRIVYEGAGTPETTMHFYYVAGRGMPHSRDELVDLKIEADQVQADLTNEAEQMGASVIAVWCTDRDETWMTSFSYRRTEDGSWKQFHGFR